MNDRMAAQKTNRAEPNRSELEWTRFDYAEQPEGNRLHLGNSWAMHTKQFTVGNRLCEEYVISITKWTEMAIWIGELSLKNWQADKTQSCIVICNGNIFYLN